jgi:hypothetical protein
MDISAEETIKVAKDAVICSKHFRNSDYDECKKQYKILKRVCIGIFTIPEFSYHN